MDYFFYNTDADGIIDKPKPRFKTLIEGSFAAIGGDPKTYGEQFRNLKEGDILLMYENKVGVVAIGKVLELWNGLHYSNPLYYTSAELHLFSGAPLEYRIKVNWFLNLSDIPVGLDYIQRHFGSKYTPRGAVRKIDKYRLEIEEMIGNLLNTHSTFQDETEIIPSDINYPEGKTMQVLVNSFERNHVARIKCIEHYGFKCQVCDISFYEKYGEIGSNFIHVHHKVDLSTIGYEYSVDPISDLIPVCPNCHSMLHMKKPSYTVDELKSKIKEVLPSTERIRN